MVEHFKLKEIWLPSEETLENSKGPSTPSKMDSVKRVAFGSRSLSRSGHHSHAEDDQKSEDGDSRSDESESRIYFRSPSRCGLYTVDELDVPRIAPESMLKQARANVFISANFYECEKLLVIVQGAGMIRPGQWSRSLCITHSVHAGSILDYLYLAKEMNMGVLILNPNQNELKLRIRALETPGVGVMSAQHVYGIPGHNTHIAHILTVFDDFIELSKAKELYFVGNGRGGDTILQLLNHRLEGTPVASNSAPRTPGPVLRSKRTTKTRENGLLRLKKIAFINSAHTRAYANSERVKTFFGERSVHWVLSPLPLDTVVPEQDDMYGCTCVSAGHSKADFAAACTPNSVFSFFFGDENSTENSSQIGSPSAKFSLLGSPAKNGSPLPFTPRRIPFSNPPQLGNGDGRRNGRLSRSGTGGTDTDSEGSIHDSEPSALRRRVESTQRSSTTSRQDSSSYESHANPVHWARRRYQQGDEKFDPLIDLVEMVEMGTQTEPLEAALPIRTDSPLRDSNGLSSLLSETYPESEAPVAAPQPRPPLTPPPFVRQETPTNVERPFQGCSCPFCRISEWILSGKTTTFLLVALLTAGALTCRHLLLRNQAPKMRLR